jgi:hypothetical protein
VGERPRVRPIVGEVEMKPPFEDAERAMTQVRKRFGSDAVRPARLVEPGP